MIKHKIRIAMLGLALSGISLLSSTVIAEPSQPQIDALRDIYNDLNGQEWTDNTGWNAISNPCEGWAGITCDATGTNITKLFFDNNNAFGSIPASISDLTELQELVIIRVNLVNSNIPSSIGSLSKLKGLYLNDNKLIGTIPAELGQLTQLENLHLDDNRLTGSIPIGLMSLTKLFGLRLHHNYLTGSIPTEISNLTNLAALTLQRNSLSGVIPSSLVDLININEINLDWNALHTADGTLSTLINQKSSSDNYIDTQTIDTALNRQPEIGETAVKLNWDQRNTTPTTEGGYRIYLATDAAGPYALNQTVSNKTSYTTRIEGLTADTTYFFQVRSYTSPHEENRQATDLESSGLLYSPVEVTTLAANSGNDTVSEIPVTQDDDTGNSSSSGGSSFWLLLVLLSLGLKRRY